MNHWVKNGNNLETKILFYSNDIMIVYIYYISRSSSIRLLEKALGFFESFISYNDGYNQKYPEQKFHIFQFFKYN